jgi:putative Ig domain-containing protein
MAQNGAATGEPLVIQTASLPKAYLRQQYHFQLQAQGGIAPLRWQIAEGALPSSMTLRDDGELGGAPNETGGFRFVVTVTDSGKPAQQRNQELTLQVVAPLLVEWRRRPKVDGQRVDASIKVSNETGDDFDLTVVALAVANNGRATAIGYQRFTLKKETADFEIPFGDNLPNGAYEVNVDVVAEVAATNSIYRARLTDKAQVTQGP